jgi:hypothetical protein
MSKHTDTPYQDAFAVVSGLDRMKQDMDDLKTEVGDLATILRQVLRKGTVSESTLFLFKDLQRQLTWLAGDVERMHAALGKEDTHHGR